MPYLIHTKRNNKFNKVVIDRRGGKKQVFGKTDNLVIVYDILSNTDAVYGSWESEHYSESEDLLNVIGKWKGLHGQYEGRENLELCLDNRITEIRRGNMTCMNDDSTESAADE